MARRVRWQNLVTGGLLAAAIGCSHTPRTTDLFSRTGQPADPVTPVKTDPAFAAPATQTVRTGWFGDSTAKTKAGIKPETEVAFADTQVEAAFTEGRTPAERDQLLDTARQRYQKALKADPKLKKAYLGLANLYVRIEDYPAAVTAYRQYLDQNPKDHAVQHDLAVAYGKAQDWANATAACEAALALDRENRVYQKTLGMCLVRSGKYDEGYTIWLKVMPEAKARFFLARALEHTGQTALVKQQVQLALAADPTYEPAQSFLAYLNGEQPANAVQQAGFNNQQ